MERQQIHPHEFTRPVQVVQPPGDQSRLMVITQKGKVRVIRDGQLLSRSFLDLRDQIAFAGGPNEERGLLSIAFPPDYQTSRRFYAFFTNNDSDIRIKEFLRSNQSPDLALKSSQRALFRIDHPSQRRRNHYGGQLAVSPAGKLFVSIGDAGGEDPGNRAQSLDSLFGKLLRVDPAPASGADHGVPPDNPFVGVPGARGEIWALGLRNPWRFSFDGTRLQLPDVGEERFEELNLFPSLISAKGVNLGWSGYEGPEVFHAGREPAVHRGPDFFYCHDLEDPACTAGFAGCSIVGGAVAHDPALPELEGLYVYGDFCEGELRSLDPDDPVATDAPLDVIVSPFSLTSVGTDNAGAIYATSLTGRIYRLVPAVAEVGP